MKSSKTSFLRNCISGWNVRTASRYVISCIFRLFVAPSSRVLTWGSVPFWKCSLLGTIVLLYECETLRTSNCLGSNSPARRSLGYSSRVLETSTHRGQLHSPRAGSIDISHLIQLSSFRLIRYASFEASYK